MLNIGFSYEFFLKNDIVKKILHFRKYLSLKPDFITITHNYLKINRKIINYFIFNKINIAPHLVCFESLKIFNYKFNLYYINNLKNVLIIKGDQKISNNYYSYNLLNNIKKNYKDFFKIYLGCYTEFHPNNIFSLSDIKNNIIKSSIIKKNIYFITQYFYNIESFSYFIDDLKKKKNLKIIAGIIMINCLKQLYSFSKICKTEIPSWFFKKINNIFFKRFFFKKINKEIMINIILKLIKLKIKKIHIYTMSKVFSSNMLCEDLIIIINV